MSKQRKKAVLVTGSEGLIGYRLCQTLHEAGFSVVRYDLKTGQDLMDFSLLFKMSRKVDGIVHLAAVSRVVDAFKNPLGAVRTNVLGTTHVLEAVRTIKKPPWIIFGSSREVYGEPRSLPVKESTTPRPINVYGATKLAGESLIDLYGQTYGLRTMIIRFSNVYGHENDHNSRVIPAFVRRAMTGDDLIVNGGHQTFDFVHVDDATKGIVSAIDLISKGPAIQNETVHLASGVGTSIMRLARLVLRITNSSSGIRFSKARGFDVKRFVGDPSKARRELGWSARIKLEEGLRKYSESISS